MLNVAKDGHKRVAPKFSLFCPSRFSLWRARTKIRFRLISQGSKMEWVFSACSVWNWISKTLPEKKCSVNRLARLWRMKIIVRFPHFGNPVRTSLVWFSCACLTSFNYKVFSAIFEISHQQQFKSVLTNVMYLYNIKGALKLMRYELLCFLWLIVLLLFRLKRHFKESTAVFLVFQRGTEFQRPFSCRVKGCL